MIILLVPAAFIRGRRLFESLRYRGFRPESRLNYYTEQHKGKRRNICKGTW